jgi:hypothetical protein
MNIKITDVIAGTPRIDIEGRIQVYSKKYGRFIAEIKDEHLIPTMRQNGKTIATFYTR